MLPVRDRPEALARCLAALSSCRNVVVVDDASARPEWTVQAAAAAGARVVAREHNGGPAAARNTGLALCATPYVAFVDSDCRPEPGWLEPLLAHLRDPAVGVVAPRIRPEQGARGWLACYQRVRSSLDLGSRPGPVLPGSRIGYVPSAALLARREALGAGFAESLRTGEDVDLVWRVHAAGWTVRYEPAAVVRHAHRPRLRDWAGRQHAYGTAAAPLARRHPGQLPPVAASPSTFAGWTLALSGRPRLGAAVVGVAAAVLARRLPVHTGRTAESVRLVAGGTVAAGEQLARAMTRTWWPLALVAAATSRRARLAVLAGGTVPALLDWLRTRPRLDPVRFAAAALIDDVAYGSGVWRGCIRNRTAAPLLPRLTSRTRSAAGTAASGPGGGVSRDQT